MINVLLFDLPVTVHGFVIENDIDCYTIVINARLSKQMQTECYRHELEHIAKGDFEKHDADSIEMERHKSAV